MFIKDDIEKPLFFFIAWVDDDGTEVSPTEGKNRVPQKMSVIEGLLNLKGRKPLLVST